MDFYAQSDIGMKRSCNQDAFCLSALSDDIVLAVVCDGMGGANAGNIASSMAVETIKKYILKSFSPALPESAIENLLRAAVSTANDEVYSRATQDIELRGMGTTVVATIVKENTAHIVHIGDSRAYLINNEIMQLTRDHSVVQKLLDEGTITVDEAKTHPKKNVITRALGTLPVVEGEYDQIDITDSVLLLCTDGLSGVLSTDEIRQIVGENMLKDVPKLLIDAANAKPSTDNVTVAVISGQ